MEKIYKILGLPVTALLGVLIITIFIAFILPDQAAKAAEYTPENGAFDTALYTPPSDVYARAAEYSNEGRSSYIRARWTFDLLFPLSYGFFCLTALALTSRSLFNGKLKWLLLFPLIAVVFDLAENSFVTAVMNTLAGPRPLLAWGVTVSTIVKWIFVSLSFAGALLGLVSVGIVSIINRKRRYKGY